MTEKFVGVQLGPQSVFDEGADHVLDLLQRTASINALLVYSHTYYPHLVGRPPEAIADHGVPIPDLSWSRFPRCWVTPHDEYYAGTALRHDRLLAASGSPWFSITAVCPRCTARIT